MIGIYAGVQQDRPPRNPRRFGSPPRRGIGNKRTGRRIVGNAKPLGFRGHLDLLDKRGHLINRNVQFPHRGGIHARRNAMTLSDAGAGRQDQTQVVAQQLADVIGGGAFLLCPVDEDGDRAGCRNPHDNRQTNDNPHHKWVAPDRAALGRNTMHGGKCTATDGRTQAGMLLCRSLWLMCGSSLQYAYNNEIRDHYP